MQRPAPPEPKEHDHPKQRADQPEQHVCQVDPDSGSVSRGVGLDVEVAEDAEDDDPEETM